MHTITIHVESTPEMTRKLVSQMFYNGEIEKEARDKSFPYSESVSWLFGLDKDRQYYMQYILSTRALQIYHHEPNKGCVERGKDAFVHACIVSCALNKCVYASCLHNTSICILYRRSP